MGTKIILPEEKIIKLYISGNTMKGIANNYNVSSPTIRKLLLNNNIELREQRKYNLNENYFEIIDSEDKAYFLGFLFADGCIKESIKPNRNNPIYSCNLKLHEKDKYIIEKFKNNIESEHVIKREKGTNCFKISINSKKLCKDLIKLGCIPKKSLILTFPEHMKTNKHVNHFIRGYFDGDGTIGIYTQKNRTDFVSTISILGTYEFCKGTQAILAQKNIKSFIKKYNKKNNKKNTYYLSIYAREEQVKFIDFIYNNSNIYLKRKKDKSNSIIDLYNFRFKFKENKSKSRIINKFNLKD